MIFGVRFLEDSIHSCESLLHSNIHNVIMLWINPSCFGKVLIGVSLLPAGRIFPRIIKFTCIDPAPKKDVLRSHRSPMHCLSRSPLVSTAVQILNFMYYFSWIILSTIFHFFFTIPIKAGRGTMALVGERGASTTRRAGVANSGRRQ